MQTTFNRGIIFQKEDMSANSHIGFGENLPTYHPEFWSGIDVTQSDQISALNNEARASELSPRKFNQALKAVVKGLNRALVSGIYETANYQIDSDFNPHPQLMRTESVLAIEEEYLVYAPNEIEAPDEEAPVISFHSQPPLHRPYLKYWSDYHAMPPEERQGQLGETTQFFPEPHIIHLRQVLWGAIIEHQDEDRVVQPFRLQSFKVKHILGAPSVMPSGIVDIAKNPILPFVLPIEIGEVHNYSLNTPDQLEEVFALGRVLGIDVIQVTEPKFSGRKGRRARNYLAARNPKFGIS